MGSMSLVHWIIVALVVLVLFGRGRISEVMGDFGKGIKSFKEGMTDETANRPAAPPQLPTSQAAVVPPANPSTPAPASTPTGEGNTGN